MSSQVPDTSEGVGGWRQALRSELTSLSPAYGLTLVIWATGALLDDYIGTPAAWEVFAFVASSLVGIVLAASVAFRRSRPVPRSTEPARAADVVHVFSVMAAVLVAWLATALLHSKSAWALAPFAVVSTLEGLVALKSARG